MKKTLLMASLLAASIFGAMGLANAATQSSSFQVSATVTASCIVTATNLTFGSFNQLDGNVPATAFIKPVCSKGTPYTVYIDGGNNLNSGNRRMSSFTSPDFLTYSLMRLDGMTIGTDPASPAFSATGDGIGGADQTVQISGSLFAAQNVTPGYYADVLSITVSY